MGRGSRCAGEWIETRCRGGNLVSRGNVGLLPYRAAASQEVAGGDGGSIFVEKHLARAVRTECLHGLGAVKGRGCQTAFKPVDRGHTECIRCRRVPGGLAIGTDGKPAPVGVQVHETVFRNQPGFFVFDDKKNVAQVVPAFRINPLIGILGAVLKVLARIEDRGQP